MPSQLDSREAGRRGEAVAGVDATSLVPSTAPGLPFLRRHPDLADLVLVLVIALPTFIRVATAHLPWALWLLVGAHLGPLVWRRRRPFAVFWLVTAAALALLLARGALIPGPGVLVALYTVGVHESRRRAVLAAGVVEALAAVAAVRNTPDGQPVVVSLVFLSGMVAAGLFVGTTVRARRAYLAALEDRAERAEREQAQQARVAVIAERTRIAREMHDVVSHSVSVMVSLADGALAANREGSAAANEALRLVSSTGRTSMTEMRRLLGVLRQDEVAELAPQPGLSGLDILLDQVRATGLPVVLRVSGTPGPLPPTQETVVYRVVQEALTNAMRHAVMAQAVEVDLRWEADRVLLEVVDDGRAVPGGSTGPSAAAPLPTSRPGHGITGMRERVALFSGSLEAGPRPGGGWAVRVQLPIDPGVGPGSGTATGPTTGTATEELTTEELP